MPEIHRIADNRVSVYARDLKGGRIYYARFKVSNPLSANNQRYITETLATPSLDTALDRARQRYVEITHLEKQGKAIKTNTVAEEIDSFIEDYERGVSRKLVGFSPNMLRGFRKTIVRYFREYLGKKPLQDVALRDLERYEEWRQSYWESKASKGIPLHGNAKDRASHRTLEWEINAFKQFLRWAHTRGRYSGNALDFTFKRGAISRRSAFTATQWNALTAFMRRALFTQPGKHKNDPRLARYRRMLRTYVQVMAHTGLRVGEARNLRWRDVKFVSSKDGKSKSIRVAVASLYSKVKKAREVVGGDTAFDALDRLYQERRAAGDNANADSYIWCEADGRLINELRDGFNALIEDAGVALDAEGKKLTVYSLRHTYITFRLREGVDIYQLASNCGTSVAMIEKYYAHARNEDFAQELTKRRTKTK